MATLGRPLQDNCSDLNFDPFTYTCTDDKQYFLSDKIDPDNNFYSKLTVDSLYFTEEQFKQKFSATGIGQFSLIHFNCRSLASNFIKLKESITTLEFKFDVIALSESWLSDNDNDIFCIEGYDILSCSRLNKKGGGVVLYIKESLQYKYLPEKSKCIDNCAEILSVEIALEKDKKATICCIYRAPNTNLDMLSDFMYNAIFRNKRNKTIYVCGDFNVDLLQYDKHRDTNNFVDQLYSLGLHPLITRPTRITNHSNTLIDNIYTTDVTSCIQSGLIINDMTDHLPIFQITEYKHNNNITIIHSSRRLANERNINTLINDLVNADWKEIYDSDDINCMYNTFTEIITELYQSNCPIIYEKVKRKRPDKPWMTNGLKNACRKKNLLYKEFLKTRTIVSEEKYKKYKNKLTAILRRCEKQYFTELLEINKGNMKETWKILNGLINKKSKGKQICTEFNGDESKITGDKTIANGFNNFFVNIGPSLAKRIPKCKDSLFTQFLPDKVEDTMFLRPVTEEEIMQQVKNAKNKKSKDHDQFDMCLVKKIIPYIVKPLAHICNTSQERYFSRPDENSESHTVI